MANLYLKLINSHQEEVNNFPIIFAFNEKQLKEGMLSLELQPDETDKLISFGMGGFLRKTDVDAFMDMGSRHAEEIKAAINDSENGEQFIFDMFNYELSNHEYSYTNDITDTLNALGLSMEVINSDERLKKGLEKACAYQQNSEN